MGSIIATQKIKETAGIATQRYIYFKLGAAVTLYKCPSDVPMNFVGGDTKTFEHTFESATDAEVIVYTYWDSLGAEPIANFTVPATPTTLTSTYGYLYNGYAVAKDIAPEDWHCATTDDWNDLINSAGGAAVAGKMKEAGTTHWTTPNTGAANNKGVYFLPTGSRTSTGGVDTGRGLNGIWWGSVYDNSNFDRFYLDYDSSYFTKAQLSKIYGFSVRCVRDYDKPYVAGAQFTDPRDGLVYDTISAGGKIWMTADLRTTKYKSGLPITLVQDSSDWRNSKIYVNGIYGIYT